MRAVTRLFAVLLISAIAAAPLLAAIGDGNPLGCLAELKDFRAMRASSTDPDWHNGNADFRPIEPGQTLTLADLKGPGQIAHIWFTISARDKFYSKLLTLRMYWDGEKEPSVECPIGDFFAAGHGLDVYVNSIPVRVSSDGRGRNCYWPMPFRKSARITVTNDGFGRVNSFYYYIDWQARKSLPANTAYFHAQYRQEVPCKPGPNYLILDAVGKGHYVGTVQSVRLNEPGWYGEGDDFFFIDGEKEPSLKGTGTEDYFCDGWGFRKFDGPFYGVPIFEGVNTGDRSSVYRWHLPDPIPFTKSLRVEIEHKGSRNNVGGFVERFDDFSTVAYWYQTEPHKRFTTIPPGKDRLEFDPTAIIQMESLLQGAVSTPAGKLSVQQGVGMGDGQLWFTPESADGEVTVPLSVKAAGTYELVLFATASWDYGIYQPYLDGKELGGRVDFMNPAVTAWQGTLGRAELTAGEHKLTFRNLGKNEQSKGYFLGLDGILLKPVK